MYSVFEIIQRFPDVWRYTGSCLSSPQTISLHVYPPPEPCVCLHVFRTSSMKTNATKEVNRFRLQTLVSGTNWVAIINTTIGTRSNDPLKVCDKTCFTTGTSFWTLSIVWCVADINRISGIHSASILRLGSHDTDTFFCYYYKWQLLGSKPGTFEC
jgi:hypothetical protein